jgi:hypothetical protein
MKRILLVILVVFAASQYGLTQCDQFVKQECLPELGPFTDIGKKNIAVLLPGDTAQIGVTFYKLHQYRIVVCGQPSLGKIQFRLMDRKGSVLFDSKSHNSPQFWDFNTQATQNVIIQLVVPSVPPTQVAQTGCVSVLVGFKGEDGK